jgi:hypothetical protein
MTPPIAQGLTRRVLKFNASAIHDKSVVEGKSVFPAQLTPNLPNHLAIVGAIHNGTTTGRVGQDSVDDRAIRYGLEGPGIESLWGFYAPVQTGPLAHPASYTMGSTRSFPRVKRPRRGVDHPPPYSAELKERVQLYLYSPSGPSWPVLGWNLPLLLLDDTGHRDTVLPPHCRIEEKSDLLPTTLFNYVGVSQRCIHLKIFLLWVSAAFSITTEVVQSAWKTVISIYITTHYSGRRNVCDLNSWETIPYVAAV